MNKVVFIHPDLGIGGAERAMVDAALALKSKGYDCHFYTAHHDKNHCFNETKDGTFPVKVYGNFLPRSLFQYFHVIFAYLRMIVVTLYWCWFGESANIVICDQISACIPFLKWFSKAKVLFYCHFPDKLLAQRNSQLRRLYRFPIDWIEEWTTGMADKIVVNSKFTARIFKQHFKSLHDVNPDIVYPVPDFTPFDKDSPPLPQGLAFDGKVFLSLNRYERKKNIGLAIEAFDDVLSRLGERPGLPSLVIAGGYDDRVKENVDHHDELADYARRLGIEDRVTFLRSVTDQLKHALLKHCHCLLYTPENEHFGIVPVEAMYCRLPVIAANSGGPLETVSHGETGFLCEPKAERFADRMLELLDNEELRIRLGKSGHARMVKHFSFESYADKLGKIVGDLLEK